MELFEEFEVDDEEEEIEDELADASYEMDSDGGNPSEVMDSEIDHEEYLLQMMNEA